MSKAYSTIIWDWNGTLLDDVEISLRSMLPLLEARSLPLLTREQYRNIFGFPVRDYYQRIGFDFNKENFQIPANQFMDNYRKFASKATLFQDTSETLSVLKNKGYQQIILSAMESSLLKEMTNKAGLDRYISCTYGLSDDYADSKVHLGKKMIYDLNLEPATCLMIGDTIHDSEVAESCGFDCILYAGGHFSKERLQTTGKPIIDTLSELQEIL